METRGEELNVPSEHVAVVARFADRGAAEEAIDALKAAGFADDAVSIVARGAGTDDAGVFVPGGLMVTVLATGREDAALRVLRAHEAQEVSTNRVGATGTVGQRTV